MRPRARKLPYALQYLYREQTEFFLEHPFRLLESYDELIAKGGVLADLVERQRLDKQD